MDLLSNLPAATLAAMRHDLVVSIISELGRTSDELRESGKASDSDILSALLHDLSKVVTGHSDEAEAVMVLAHGRQYTDQAKRHAEQIARQLGIR